MSRKKLTPCYFDLVCTAATASRLLFCVVVGLLGLTPAFAQQPFDPAQGILLHGTVVAMDAAGTILHHGTVLVRNGRIVAVWQGSSVPKGTPIDNAVSIDLGPKALIFPGLINLHNHPTYNMLELWPAPASHVEANRGRPLGTEPYANRYQWSIAGGMAAPEFLRLVDTPQTLLNSSIGLNLFDKIGKYAEVKALVGGETTVEEGPQFLLRNPDRANFGRHRIESFVPAISSLSASEANALLTRMQNGEVDAWIVHLAEGVRDGQRRPGDTFSSRGELATLAAQGLLNDTTVIIHGNGLEPQDFAAMRAAASVRADGTGDGLGAKLVWSPLSNLLLYGQTALIYHALKEGVTISLGTDWSPSGSRNLLDELKIADIALRDPRLLASDRDLVPTLSITDKGAKAREAAEIALDKLLIEMVTSNPAKTLRWTEVGSIEPGKVADLFVITRPDHVSAEQLPNSPYRNLIDATEEEVRLVLANGEPLSGDVALMALLKPGHYEIIESVSGCFQKAIDVISPAIPNGTETFAEIEKSLRDALNAMGGDIPPAGGGPADNSNTYSYLKSHIPGASFLTDAQIRQELTFFFGLALDGHLNMEGTQLSPVFVQDDDFYFDLIGGETFSGSGLIADDTPPFGLYLSNLNQVQPLGNPFAANAYRNRYFGFCASRDQ